MYKSESSYAIKNALPSPPPTFLRSGKLILTNKPATRVADLTSKFTLLSALSTQTSRSSGSFIASYDFSNNTQINSCVEKGCSIKISINKDTGSNYLLEWNYTGRANIDINI